MCTFVQGERSTYGSVRTGERRMQKSCDMHRCAEREQTTRTFVRMNEVVLHCISLTSDKKEPVCPRVDPLIEISGSKD